MCQSISKKLILFKKINRHEIFYIVSEMRMHTAAAAAALFLCFPATAVLLPKEVQSETDARVQMLKCSSSNVY
jgi:hypothetical protein